MRWFLHCFIFCLVVMNLEGCATFDTPSPVIRANKEPTKIFPGLEGTHTSIGAFLTAYDVSFTNRGDSAYALELTKDGLNLMDSRCDDFFARIGKGAQGLDFSHRETETITGVLVAALGTASVSKDAITGVGLGSNLLLRSFDNFGDVYFFSPDVGSVQNLVKAAESKARAAGLSNGNAPKTFNEAIGFLREYQNICTVHQIKSLISASVDAGTNRVQAQFGDKPGAADAAVTDYLPVLASKLGLDTLTPDQFVLLAWATQKPTPAEQSLICATMEKAVKDKFCTGSPPVPDLTTNGPLWQAVADGITGINAIAPDYLKVRLGATKDRLSTQTALITNALEKQAAAELARDQAQSKLDVATHALTNAPATAAPAVVTALNNNVSEATKKVGEATTSLSDADKNLQAAASVGQVIAKQAAEPSADTSPKLILSIKQ